MDYLIPEEKKKDLFDVFYYHLEHENEDIEEYLALITPENITDALSVAIDFGQNGYFIVAERIFDRLTKLCPSSEVAWFNKALTLHQLGNYREAINSFNKVLKINAGNYRAWHYKGVAFLMLNENKAAFEAFEKTLKIDKNLAETWVAKGIAAEKLNNIIEALKCFQTAQKIDPNYDLAWYNHALLLERIGKHTDARELFEQALLINPALIEAEDLPNRWCIPATIPQADALPNREELFRIIIQKIVSLYEWEQCDRTIRSKLMDREWTLLESILEKKCIETGIHNGFSWNEPLHVSLIKKLWDHLTLYQRKVFLYGLSPDQWDIIRTCIASDEIHNLLTIDNEL